MGSRRAGCATVADRRETLHKGALYKTRPCFEFRDTGKCKLGDRCNYAHGDVELRPDRGAPPPPPPAPGPRGVPTVNSVACNDARIDGV